MATQPGRHSAFESSGATSPGNSHLRPAGGCTRPGLPSRMLLAVVLECGGWCSVFCIGSGSKRASVATTADTHYVHKITDYLSCIPKSFLIPSKNGPISHQDALQPTFKGVWSYRENCDWQWAVHTMSGQSPGHRRPSSDAAQARRLAVIRPPPPATEPASPG